MPPTSPPRERDVARVALQGVLIFPSLRPVLMLPASSRASKIGSYSRFTDFFAPMKWLEISLGLRKTILIGAFGTICGMAAAEPSVVIAEKNPYWAMANRNVARTVAFTDSELLKDSASNAFWLAWGYTAPQSETRGNKEMLGRLIALWDWVANVKAQEGAKSHFEDAEKQKDPKANFWNTLPFIESLLILRNANAVPLAQQRAWAASLLPFIEDDFREYGHATKRGWASAAAKNYPNADAQHLAAMYAAYKVYGDERFKENAREFVAAMESHLRAPGAWLYYLGSTPIPLYHGFEIMFLGRYYQMSGDERAADMIRRTKDYYPYTYVPENTVEYSSSPWWKQMWNSTGGPYHAPEIVAWLAGDGRNRWFADLRTKLSLRHSWVAYCGEAWDAGAANRATPEPFPDRYIVPDSSIDGLRGRFGSFSFVGSRGKNTGSFGGCMLADASLPSGYDGYMQLAHIGVEISGKAKAPYYEALRLVADPAEIPTPGAQLIEKDFAALAVRYIPRAQLTPDISFDDWQSEETWLFTPNAVVAVMKVTALKDSPETYPQGIVRLGPASRPTGLDNNKFFVGNLHGQILLTDFPKVELSEGSSDQYSKETRSEIRLRLQPRPARVSKGDHWLYAMVLSPQKDISVLVERKDDSSFVATVDGTGYNVTFFPDLGVTKQ